MLARIRSAGVGAVFLVVLLPLLTLAQNVNFSLAPAEVHIDSLLPGNATEFELTVNNRDAIARNFTITVFRPPKEERREGRTEFPDESWITFSSSGIEIGANSHANVTVTVAIPQEQKWAGRDWETWLAVTAESSDLLSAKLYARLLVSTGGTRLNTALVAGIAAGALILGCGGYYWFRRKVKRD